MDVTDFERLLRQGRGLPLLYLRNHNAAPYQDAVLYACIHDLRYDHQCEDSREQYLYELILATRQPSLYRDSILDLLSNQPTADDADQWMGLARCFASGGDEEARHILYDAFRRGAREDDVRGGWDIVQLDGIPGLLYCLDYVEVDDSDANWEPGSWLNELEERDGKVEAWLAMETAAGDHPKLARLLEIERRSEEQAQQRRTTRKNEPPPTFDDLQRLIVKNGEETSRYWLRRWGSKAADEDLERAARRLTQVTDPGLRRAYARVFTARSYPLLPDPLLEMAQDPDEETAQSALLALGRICHPAVRALALELVTSPGKAVYAVEMLSASFQPGDHALVEAAMAAPPLDPDDLHWLGRSVWHFAQMHTEPEAVPALKRVFETIPCTLCRSGVVELLHELGGLTSEMRDECRFDAYLFVREKINQWYDGHGGVAQP